MACIYKCPFPDCTAKQYRNVQARALSPKTGHVLVEQALLSVQTAHFAVTATSKLVPCCQYDHVEVHRKLSGDTKTARTSAYLRLRCA